MNRGRYSKRACRNCKGTFFPAFPNQQTHAGCRRLWKRRYRREYERKARRELKRGWDDEGT
ncbi:MAG: hypothetical protein ACYCPQ_00680 [Elusimicrobiota bacterium]